MTTNALNNVIQGLCQPIDRCIEEISERHRMHRKVKLLLDIRGLLVINKIQGAYAEFGVFRGEMMYAAAKVLGEHIRRFIGADTFHGLPEPRDDDEDSFIFERTGFMSCPKARVEALMQGYDIALVDGDFRDPDVQDRFKSVASPLSVVSIDCNWPSSVKAAVHLSAPLLQTGSIVYLDDYFVGTRRPNFNVPIMAEAARQFGIKWIDFMTYPPCGRAFIIERLEESGS